MLSGVSSTIRTVGAAEIGKVVTRYDSMGGVLISRFRLISVVIAIAILSILGSGVAGLVVYRRLIASMTAVGASEARAAASGAAPAVGIALSGVRHTLEGAGLREAFGARLETADCGRLLEQLRSTLPDERLVSRVDVLDDGVRSCSSSHGTEHADYAAAVVRDGTGVGKPVRMASGEWVVALSATRANSHRALVAFVSLTTLNALLFPEPGEALVTVTDGQRDTMLRSESFEARVGKQVPMMDVVMDLDERARSSPFQVLNDGTLRPLQDVPVISPDSVGEERVWVSLPVPEVSWMVFSGVRTANAYAKLGTSRWVVALGPATAAAVALAVIALLLLVARDLRRLSVGVSRARTLGAAAISTTGFAEVARLGEAFSRALAERAEAVEANRAKDAFFAVMSHELRTPLTSMLGLVEATAAGVYGELSKQQRDKLTLSMNSGQKLLTLVNGVLDYTRLQGDVEIGREPIDLRGLVDAAVSGVSASAKAGGVRVEVTASHGIVMGDPRRLAQVLRHLLSNAVKFTAPGGTVTLQAAVNDQEVTFTISDHGAGIAPEDHARIFEPFEQVQHGLNRSHQGIGLGLALSKVVVERHGGTIAVASAPGEGATFTVRLPRRWGAESASGEPLR